MKNIHSFNLYFIILLFIGFGHHGLAQNSFPAEGNATVKRAGATLFIINDSQSAWSRAGLVLNNPYQVQTTNFEILYEKNATGSAGTSSAVFRKSNTSGFLNYMQFNDAHNSIYLFANKSGSQTFGNLYLSNGNLLLGSNSRVGVGTNNPTHKLEVNGTIRAKEVKLEATNWPDYVFEEGYKLLPLEEVKAHIDQKGHLPGLKPAKEYESEGVNMMELNRKLLEKIEELTLYLIEQRQESAGQMELIKRQRDRMDILEGKLGLPNN